MNSLNTSSLPYIEILRGRDGRDGRDGVPGPRRPQGKGEILEQQVLRVSLANKGKTEILKALRVPLGHKDRGGWLVQ